MPSSWEHCYTILRILDSCPKDLDTSFSEDPLSWIINGELAIISLIPTLLFIKLLVMSFLTKNTKCRALFGIMLVSIIVAEFILKHSFKQSRPEGAWSGSYGMPSGHSSVSICLFFFWAFYCFRGDFHYIFLPISALFVTNVAISRLYLGYHNITQVAGGFATGTALSIVYLWCLAFYLNKYKVKKRYALILFNTLEK